MRQVFELFLIAFIFGYLTCYYSNPIDGWKTIEINAEQRYDKETYNCLDFSKDLVSKLKAENYESEIVIGDVPEGRHAWVALWVEPITGKLVRTGDNYKKDYEADIRKF